MRGQLTIVHESMDSMRSVRSGQVFDIYYTVRKNCESYVQNIQLNIQVTAFSDDG